ncbi:DUF4870 family protein [Marinomonas ostreistagni]|uniref:Transmembrane protein n=1 Tax=Marinomonas ostreistagni TaxID=359209 RepID=A0ABS0ZET3_9GAMM|nr:hypothetical protein [Marinomonas ostreistagni]MBJ7552177.1 hypothetical protein [Marinomonas ostreistagni]
MNDDNPMSAYEAQAKQNALIAYGFMLLGLFTGVFWLVGAVWAMAKAREAKLSVFYDHYQNMISIFWWGLGISIVGFLLALFFIGYVLLLGVWLWSVIKLFKGLFRLLNDQPYQTL